MKYPAYLSISLIATAIPAGCGVMYAASPIQMEQPLKEPAAIRFLFPPRTGADRLTALSQGNADRLAALHIRNFNERFDDLRITVLRWDLAEGACSVSRYVARPMSDSREHERQLISYACTITAALSDGVDVKFTSMRSLTEHFLVSGRPVDYGLSFTVEQAVRMLSAATFQTSFEVDSEFNADSTYANFARLTRTEASGKADPVTGKIFKDRFWIKVDDREIPVFVETFPYRNGSKAVVHANLPGAVSGGTVDFARYARELKLAVERIVRA